jgi:uncharacterized peroxidase-related enzyme
VESHAEFLRLVSLDEELTAALRRDYRQAPGLSDQDRALLAFAARLTTRPAAMTRADVDGLRRAGFGDRAVLQITLIAAWFNYVNRVADALGVGRDGEPSPPEEGPWSGPPANPVRVGREGQSRDRPGAGAGPLPGVG